MNFFYNTKKYWKNIKKNYPKAFSELCLVHDTQEELGYIDHPEIWGTYIDEPPYVLRHLYEFFMQYEIYFYVDIENGQWYYFIHDDKKMKIKSSLFKKREIAELKCYEKSFFILEEKLNKISVV